MSARHAGLIMLFLAVVMLSGCAPVVTGACCDDGVCLEVTESECYNRGGTYYGGFSSCEVRRCP
ncbi:MAG: hypothetical protein H6817_04535 [Phycisphaerales bacterium]|nr:hypothetical protein [Phycisphaerales bacterium]